MMLALRELLCLCCLLLPAVVPIVNRPAAVCFVDAHDPVPVRRVAAGVNLAPRAGTAGEFDKSVAVSFDANEVAGDPSLDADRAAELGEDHTPDDAHHVIGRGRILLHECTIDQNTNVIS